MYKTKLRILIAEDHGVMRSLLGRILHELGLTNLVYASNGAEAVELGLKDRPHLAFLDVDMPEKSGIDVMKELLRADPSCYCVVISAHNEASYVKAAVQAGARAFIVKPYSPQRISDILLEYATAQRSRPGGVADAPHSA
jgi:two-component system chemotaxis response regulator CheY